MTTPMPNDADPGTYAVDIHDYDDVDTNALAHHHTLGLSVNQAAFGNHTHTAPTVFVYTGSALPVVSAGLPVGALYTRTGAGAVAGARIYIYSGTAWVATSA